ncbi:uncharacterized protein J7T54_004173 [Emericellopsis cladophorae]|uniref:U6 small nuclear RNA (adenine-(43)-N(6))-methyltransferase n=1 Tax=Emericellopsis cladophorae TaxID=2686198 RepID=A0A9Q0BB42_9HYPO|nr:uncharacterized protein J7T54_004173 [Emericellopsis cladophorae]KAI6778266.1 hypothetical protein J7T54_004173 [Emericellopsis cladophorae]
MDGKRKQPHDEPKTRAEPHEARGNSDVKMQSHEPADPGRRWNELYADPVDFKALALRDAAFAAVVKGREVNFNDPKAVQALTKALLKKDFGLCLETPDDRLCPPVANRHNYILWLKKLLDSTSYEPRHEGVLGLDIGTGASCIYPLLGCTQRPWSFIATDIDAKSLEFAQKNVKRNGLDAKIRLVPRQPTDKLIPLDDLGIDAIDFCMTNPPFYTSDEQMRKSAEAKDRPPSTACTGVAVEMVTAGGEVGFVKRIIEESLAMKHRVGWYTSMVGFLASVIAIVEELRTHGIHNYAVTEFVQGNKTRRWAVGWSFRTMRPAQAIARGSASATLRAYLPAVAEAEVARLGLGGSISKTANGIRDAIGELDLMHWAWDQQKMQGTGRAADNVWNRAWRRKKKKMEMEGDHIDVRERQDAAFGFEVWIRVGTHEMVVGCRWLEGHDAKIFESFQGFLASAAKAHGSLSKVNN